MKKDNNNIDSLMDKDFENFIKNKFDEEFAPDIDAKERIKNRLRLDSHQLGKDLSTEIKELKTESNVSKHSFISIFRRFNMNNKSKKQRRKIVVAAVAAIAVVAAVAAIAVVVGIGKIGVIGKDYFTETKRLKSGYIEVIQEKMDVNPNELSVTLQSDLVGKIFDENGKPVTKLTAKNEGKIYDKDGNKIIGFSYDESTGKRSINTTKSDNSSVAAFNTVEEASKSLNFKPYSLAGFGVEKITAIKDEKTGKVDPNFATVYLRKGNEYIKIFMRTSSPENGFVTNADKIEQVKLKGEDAILANGNRIYWSHNHLLLDIDASSSNYKNKDLINLIENIK